MSSNLCPCLDLAMPLVSLSPGVTPHVMISKPLSGCGGSWLADSVSRLIACASVAKFLSRFPSISSFKSCASLLFFEYIHSLVIYFSCASCLEFPVPFVFCLLHFLTRADEGHAAGENWAAFPSVRRPLPAGSAWHCN